MLGMGVLLVFLFVVGISYALWSTTVTQESINKITSDCLKIELKDKTAAIQLENAYPLRDKEAKELVPYEFTIRNTCNSLIKYDVNLEIMDLGENQLATQYISVSIDNGGKKRLGEQESIDPTYKDSTYTANEARSLLKRRELAGRYAPPPAPDSAFAPASPRPALSAHTLFPHRNTEASPPRSAGLPWPPF